MEEIELTLEDNLKLKESIEWGYNYYTEELNQLGYTHQAKDTNELEVYDEAENFVGKSYLEKEGQVTTRKFEATTEIPEQVAELSNQLLLIKISLGYSERNIALLQQENLVQEPAARYGSREEVPARIFPAVEHGNLKNISFEGIPSEEIRNYLKEHSWRYSRRNRAWYPGTKEAQATNEEFVKEFLEKFYPNTLSEEQIPQTLFDTIPEERETEAIPESDVNNPHSDFPDIDNQDMAEPVPESPNEEQSSQEAIAPKTEYNFTPTIGDDGIIDYTGVEADKIRLPNKNEILNQFLPSYLPPVEIRRNGRYDIPAVKVADNQYLLKGTKNGGPIYRVSLDVYAALIDYHLKYDRVAGKAIADYNNNALKEALENEQAEFFPLKTKFPTVPEPLSFESHCQPEKKRIGRFKYSPGRVSLQKSSSSSMSRESYYFIESEIGSGTSKIFAHHQQILEELHQKLLDMELQHSDLESTWTKGRETAYGDSNLDGSLLDTYGVNVKRQNGEAISAQEKTELKEILNQVYSTYGDLSSITKDYGLKVSHAGNTKMHASKAVGLFTPGMKALGISFGSGKDEAMYTANHEMAHFIDHIRGKEHHAWHASDIPGTLENKIAATFRKSMNRAKGDYWNRTCECFARAMEEYGKIVHIQQEHPEWDSEQINEKVSLPAYMEYPKFYSTMMPLIQKWIETIRTEMKINEWNPIQESPQKNMESEKITKSQTKNIRQECLEILSKDDTQITNEDLAKLRAYEGAGGLGEKDASVNGVLNEFYTPHLVVEKMWQLADAYAPNATTVLEPTAGTGRFAENRSNNQFTMYEIDKTSARINKLLHPDATVINESFQKQFFDSEGRAINKSYSIPKFDLVMGNPPYGEYKDKWRGLGEGKEFDRYEEYFLSRGLDSLKNQDSLMIMIVPSGFLNTNEDKVKQVISSKGKLLDAWRLPEGIFPTTKVGTDILVFQRGTCDVHELSNGTWFKNHPEKILGEVKTRTNRFGKEEKYVDFFEGHSLEYTLNLLVPDKSIDKLLETSSNFMEETLQENQVQEVTNAESIHQGNKGREAHLRGEGVGGQTREDNGEDVSGQNQGGGGIVKEPASPDSAAAGKPVQQSPLQHNSPTPERNDSHRSGGIGNQTGGLGGMEPHTTPLPGSIEQLSDRLTLSAQEFSRFYTGNNFSTEEYPVGKYGQLELFAFEQTPSYNNSMKAFTDELVTVLNATAIELPEIPLTQENYEKLFDRGYVESPIETLKMGENQYQKFKRTDRNNLLAAAYMTLTQPSLILEKETYDEKSEQFKPVHVYGKSFYRKESGNKRVVESIVIFKEENRIIISSHNKDVKDFVKQIKTADQIVYMDKEVGRVAVWLQEKATGHVPLQGINTRVINSSYNTDNLVSIPSLIQNSSATTVQEPSPQYITSGDPNLTKEHIWRAKAATRTYCNPILDGKKSGLWKNFRDFKKHGVLDIIGANAEMEQGKITPQGWNQLATALQIYRDKRFETFRYLFVSPEGKIQDQLAVCSHLPGKSLANLPSENLLGQVIAHAEATGTKVVLVHNHPSGNITPSVDDIRMTENIEAAFTRSDGKCLLAGHIILDHDSYNLYQKGKEWKAQMLSPYDIYDPLLKTRNPMEGITVSGPESLELVAQAVNSHDKWKEEGWVPVVFTNSSSQISAVKMYPEDFLAQNNAKLLNQLQETAKRTGAVMAFPIILDKNHISQENQKNLLDRMKSGCFTDFYLGEKDGTHRTSEDFNLVPGKNLFDEIGMEQMADQTSITSTFQRHQKQKMDSLGVFVAEENRKEYESFLRQIDDYLERGNDDKKISDWLARERVQFPLSLTKSDIDTVALKDNSVKTRSQFENSMMEKIHLESNLPEKLITPAQIREGKQELPVKHSFMVNNSFIPPMELTQDGKVQLYCTSKDLQNPISQEIKPVVLEMTPKQAAVLVDASIKKQSMENRHSKQQLPLNLPAKSKMEESFFTGLKNVHPQLTRKEAERQYHEVYSMIEKELKELRSEPAREKKNPTRRGFSMEW